MLPHYSSPFPPANNQHAAQQQSNSTGPMRPRQGPRNTASKSYVKGVESTVKVNENRISSQNERMDYIESFLSSKYGAQYEPYAIFKARENLSFTTSEINNQWALGARNDSVGNSNASGDMTPRSSKSPERPDDLQEMAREMRELKELFKKSVEPKADE